MRTLAVSHSLAPAAARLLRVASSALLVIAMLFIVAVPAQAHQPRPRPTVAGDGSYADMSSHHDLVVGCDADSDGHRAYLRLYDYWGSPFEPIYDPDGAGGDCARYYTSYWPLGSYNICVQTEGCGSPVYRYQF